MVIREGQRRKDANTDVTAHPIATARVVDGNLECAVQEYRHPDGKTILVCPLLHVAEPEFYDEVLKLILEAEESGAQVYYEGYTVGAERRTDDEQAAIDVSSKSLKTQQKGLPELFDLPWIYQFDSALAAHFEKWRSSDIRGVDMVRLLGQKTPDAFARLNDKFARYRTMKETHGPSSPRFRRVRWMFANANIARFEERGLVFRAFFVSVRGITNFARSLNGKAPLPGLTGVPDWAVPYMHGFRECIAALHALHYDGNVVMLWNPGHVRHMGEIWIRNGFVPAEPRWVMACHAVPFNEEKATQAAAKKAVKEARKAGKKSKR